MGVIKNYQFSNYKIRLGGALSRLLNVALLRGHPSESICGRCWRNRLEYPEKRLWWRLCRTLDAIWFWESNHCKNAYEYDISYSYHRVEAHCILFDHKVKVVQKMADTKEK